LDYAAAGIRNRAVCAGRGLRLRALRLLVCGNRPTSRWPLHLRRAAFGPAGLLFGPRDGGRINIRDNGGPAPTAWTSTLRATCCAELRHRQHDDCICLNPARRRRPARQPSGRVRGDPPNTTRHAAASCRSAARLRRIPMWWRTTPGHWTARAFGSSPRTRGGTIEDVLVRDIKMENVRRPSPSR